MIDWVVEDGGLTTSAAHTLVFLIVLWDPHLADSTHAPLLLSASCLAWEDHAVGGRAMNALIHHRWYINELALLSRMPGGLLGYVLADVSFRADIRHKIQHNSQDFIRACLLVRCCPPPLYMAAKCHSPRALESSQR